MKYMMIMMSLLAAIPVAFASVLTTAQRLYVGVMKPLDELFHAWIPPFDWLDMIYMPYRSIVVPALPFAEQGLNMLLEFVKAAADHFLRASL